MPARRSARPGAMDIGSLAGRLLVDSLQPEFTAGQFDRRFEEILRQFHIAPGLASFPAYLLESQAVAGYFAVVVPFKGV